MKVGGTPYILSGLSIKDLQHAKVVKAAKHPEGYGLDNLSAADIKKLSPIRYNRDPKIPKPLQGSK